MKLDYDYFEKIIAYKAITDAVYLTSIADYVKPEYFEDKNIAFYFKIVNEFYDTRNKLPTFTEIKTYLTNEPLRKGFKKLLESFKELDELIDIDELYFNTERFLRERSTLQTMIEAADAMSKGEIDPTAIYDKFSTCCSINLVTDTGIELFRDRNKIVDNLLREDATISSKWPWLDEALGGGFRSDGKSFYVFAGQANIGKSIFLGNVAANIAEQGKSVLVISLEMSEMVYAERIASNVTKIPMKDFKYNAPLLREALESQQTKVPAGKIFIKEFPPSTVTPKQIGAFIKKLKDSGEKIDAVVIDYVNLLHTSFGSNSYERIKHICEQIRALSYIFKCPFISATQLNRGGYDTENPGMDNLSESIGLAATADVILSIYQNEEDLEMGIIRLGMMKNRYGPRGMTQAMRIEYLTLTITQSDEEEETMRDEDISLMEQFAD
jgi:replicative DNA helicase